MLWKTVRTSYWRIVDIVILISVLIAFTVSVVQVCTIGFTDEIIVDIDRNFNIKPLYELTLSNDGTCYDSEEYSFGEWQGMTNGCNCNGLWSTKIPYGCKDTVCRSSCSINMTRAGCYNLASINPRPFRAFHRTNFCAKQKAINKIYKDYLKDAVKQDQQCKDGFKPCGILDSLQQVMCIENNQECPINDLIIDRNQKKDDTYKSFLLLDGFYLHYSNKKIDKPIITNTTLTENSICLDPSQRDNNNLYLLDINYPNNECTYKVGTEKYDSRYTKIDSVPKRDLYSDNNLFKYYERDENFKKALFNPPIKLYIKNYIGLDYKCLIETNFDFTIIKQHLDSQSTGHKLDIASLTFICIEVAILGAVLFCRCKDDYNFGTNTNLLIYLQMFVAFIVLILSAFSLNTFRKIDMHFNCGDPITNLAMSQVQGMFDRAFILNGVMILSSLIILILYPSDIVLDMFGACSDDNKQILYHSTVEDTEYPADDKPQNGIKAPLIPPGNTNTVNNEYQPPFNALDQPLNAQQNINSDFDPSNFAGNHPNVNPNYQNINQNEIDNNGYNNQQGFSSGGYVPNYNS